MNASIDKPFQNSLILFLFVILLEGAGVMLFLSGREWGIILTVVVMAALQAITLLLVWYTLKISFHMGREIVAIQNGVKSSESTSREKEIQKDE